MPIDASPDSHGTSLDSAAEQPPLNGESSRRPAAEPGPRLLGLTSLVVGNVIGSSIFVLPSLLAPFGGLAIVGWLITSAGAILLALVFARLAAQVPKAGGPYALHAGRLRRLRGLSDRLGVLDRVMGQRRRSGGGHAELRRRPDTGSCQNLQLAGLVAIGAVWLLTFVNLRGVQGAGRLQTITTVLKLVPLVAIGTLGLAHVNWSNFAPTVPPDRPSMFSAIIAATALTLFSYLGIESADSPGR